MSTQKYAVIVGLTFGIAFCTTYLASAADLAAVDWSVIQRCLAAGLAAVFAWFISYGTALKKELENVKATNAALVDVVNKQLGSSIH